MSVQPLAAPRLEAVKWLAFVLMALDHVNGYLLDGRYPVLFLLGRLVFPLFAMCLAFGVAGRGSLVLDGVVRRLLVWACIAQIPWSTFEHSAGLNVLFQLGAGAALYQTVFVRGLGWQRNVLGVIALPVAFLSEFGFPGIVTVFGLLWFAESRKWYAGTLAFLGLAMLFAINGTWFALLAPGVFYLLQRGPDIPRWRHAFYAMYPAHLVVIAFMRWWL